ncbi:hypothetical protein SAMN06297422_1274 [Lachnospiraceae bacterium]|nr:hypothetical protein SAMN06297422_1274 [Lachnospiraceae bacterium]
MMANVITGLRILVSAVLVFCPVFSPIFYVLYLIADFIFVAVCLQMKKREKHKGH